MAERTDVRRSVRFQIIDHLSLTSELRDRWQRDGFLVWPGFFSEHEIQALQVESDRLLTECRHLISLQNLRCRFIAHHETQELLFEVFDPVNDISGICAAFCTDQRILSLLKTLYREPACLFKEKLIFKPPGALGYQLHQDIPLSWRGFPRTFVTVLIAIDPLTEENGCTELFSGYHGDFLAKSGEEYMLPDTMVETSRLTSLVLDPGDIAVFHGLTPHRSSPNRSVRMRRVLYASYNALSDGGDQRTSHYLEFRKKLARHRQAQSKEPLYFR